MYGHCGGFAIIVLLKVFIKDYIIKYLITECDVFAYKTMV